MLDGTAVAAARVIATQRTSEDVLRAAVDVSRSLLESDLTFAASPEGAEMRVSMSSGARDPRFHQIRVAPGRGLGGQVLVQGSAMRVEDYAHDPRITPDFVDIVSGGEGLHGIMCVPIRGEDGTPAGLLYAARRAVGGLGDRAVEALNDVAAFSEIGLQAVRERARDLELERLRSRQRLAAQLHDSVGQELFAIGVAARRSLRRVGADAAGLTGALREIDAAAAAARQSLRATLQRLGAPDDELAFDARLDDAVRMIQARTGCRTSLVHRGAAGPGLPRDVEDLVLDAVVEGLRNAVKYQAARVALLVVTRRPDEVRVVVQAEAAAEEVHVPSGMSTGCGLMLLRDRARQLGGELELDLGAPEGPVLRLSVPLLAAAA